MLTSHKLLYILPDVAYITELLPTKKEHTFAIHSFRQINGEFLDDNEFIIENVGKLINKIDEDELHLILPDFLFTNTIVEVAETDEAKVIEYLKKKLLPELTLSTETHELKTFVLTNHGGKSKVQLSALEKSLMDAISLPAKEKGLKITGVSPLSWTVKSIISLEPSISIIQMGSHAYLAQHYIGIDQAISAPVSEIETLSETIKTLKGAEPSIQTVYLISNSLVEEKLKENLSETLPLQQLSSFKEEDSEMPSYVKFCIEAGMKTLSLDVFPVPRFPLPAPTVDKLELPAALPETTTTADDSTDDADDTDDVEEVSDTKAHKELSLASETAESSTEDELPKPDIAELDTTPLESDLPAPTVTPEPPAAPSIPDTAVITALPAAAAAATSAVSVAAPSIATTTLAAGSTTAAATSTAPTAAKEIATTTEEPAEAEKPQEEEPIITKIEKVEPPKPVSSTSSTTTPIIKNQSGIQPMLKMLGISFLVFLATVAIGIGAGQAFIYFTQQNTDGGNQSPVASTSPEPTPSPSPSPSPSPEVTLDPSELSILVVNATTRAGYAGATKSELEDAGFGEVTAGNAKGEYEPGIYVLMTEENTALIELLEESTGETLTYQDTVTVEDAQGAYDAVIVLAE